MRVLDKLKKVDRLVVESFMGPYMLSFFVAEFVLVMQFLWKYIDDILGKGFSVLDLMELITYFGIVQVPMALPIAILLSSVMVFGNMSEQYELASLKSAGVSLLRIMRPAICLALITAILSLFASNYFKPAANFQFQKRLRAMKAQKPSLALEGKIFNRDFGGYSIRVNEKNDEDETIKDVLIYDHTNTDKSLVNLTKAEKGKMYNSEDGSLFIMELENGTSYREMKRERKSDGTGKKYPFMRTEFKEWEKIFDMSEFDTDDDGMNINRKKEDMLNTFQLLDAMDSVDQKRVGLLQSVVEFDKVEINTADLGEVAGDKNDRSRPTRKAASNTTRNETSKSKLNKKKEEIRALLDGKVMAKKEIIKARLVTVSQYQIDSLSKYEFWYETIAKSDKNNMPIKAVQASSRKKDLLRNVSTNIKALDHKKNKYLLRLNQQYSFALICIVFLFIGAPLGSIIRKGGYGYPLLFAILFYMLFIITSIMGEKLVRSDSMNPLLAAWLSNLIVIPVALWLTVKALRDSKFEQNVLVRYIGDFFRKEEA